MRHHNELKLAFLGTVISLVIAEMQVLVVVVIARGR